MAIPLPRPSDVLGLTRSAVDQALGSATALAGLPARAFALLDGVEALLTRINQVVDRVEATLDRTDRVVTAAATLVDDAERVTRAAGTVVAGAETVATRAADTVTRAATAAGTADELLTAYADTLRRAAPMAGRFVEELSHEEVTAAIRLVDELPKLKQHLTSDILPILATLDRVGPDLHDLLDVTRDLKLAVAGIPGLGMLRRRGENRLGEDSAG
ncbi:hypothetical protein [Micromonospora echinofusca]|uniref:Ribulose 1,5-bisphosphate carboxylase large subunit n=1 Tax=Micromonospora echinofusca TaxID=47858 RepID=A0ABS3VKB0_MICEH|nr:hypothetical protein [Micromonospora echinofusca]MBO4204911.1 hypothetical protein [Micromonospora echinofusca]